MCAALFHLPCIQAWIRDGVAPPSLLSPELFPAQQRKWHWCAALFAMNHTLETSDMTVANTRMHDPRHLTTAAPSVAASIMSMRPRPSMFAFAAKKRVSSAFILSLREAESLTAVPDPRFDPWITPHSCGTPCGRKLKSNCGHTCSMLCHPGLCPPCPRQVSGRCPCGRTAAAHRCGQPAPTCGAVCNRMLSCGLHKCQARCHQGAIYLFFFTCSSVCSLLGKLTQSGECTPCELQVARSCVCGAEKKTLACGNEVSENTSCWCMLLESKSVLASGSHSLFLI
jgi:hypothetical protein